jgi:hypothetical protein
MASSGEEGVGSSGQFEMVVDVFAGVGGAERREGVAERDALVEGGEGAETKPLSQGGLADQDEGSFDVAEDLQHTWGGQHFCCGGNRLLRLMVTPRTYVRGYGVLGSAHDLAC